MLWAEPKSNGDGIRRTFKLCATKGAAILPSWGIALDFVPHVAAGAVKWHRTFASALPDLWIDTHVPADELSYLRGTAHLEGQSPHVLPTALDRAEAFWARGQDLRALPALFDEVSALRADHPRLFPADNLPQIRLAHAFVLARTGHLDEGRARLDSFIDRHRHGDVADVLRDRLRLAAP